MTRKLTWRQAALQVLKEHGGQVSPEEFSEGIVRLIGARTGWTEAVLQVMNERNGAVTLDQIYAGVARIIKGNPGDSRLKHSVRSTVARLRKGRRKVERVGDRLYRIIG